jgi:hypothetical protein
MGKMHSGKVNIIMVKSGRIAKEKYWKAFQNEHAYGLQEACRLSAPGNSYNHALQFDGLGR